MRPTIPVLSIALLGGPLAAQQAPWPTTSWATSTPAAQGIAAAPLDSLARVVDAGIYGNIDRMVVIRNGYLVLDRSWSPDYRAASAGFDMTPHQFNYQHPDYHPWHQGRRVHTLQSVTKSITATLIGIAVGRGEIRGLDQPLLGFLTDYDLSRIDPRLERATLADLLTMRTGIEWHETDRPLDSTNTTIQLEASQDWVQFTLDQPMDAAPGEKWVYNSGGSHLMSAVIHEATGQYADDYARQHLFLPLGIRDFHWKQTPTRLPDTEGGLYLEALDLARIGYLYLRDGMWNGQRVLPAGWVRNATARHVEQVNQLGWGYGYQWWRIDRGGVEIWAGLGYGGQFLLVLPDHDIVGVINSWNVFGRQIPGILLPFADALIASAN